MIQFQEKKPRQTAGRKDGQTLFHKIFLATVGGPTSTTAVEWHLKVLYRVQCWSNKILLHHSQHAKNKLSSNTHS